MAREMFDPIEKEWVKPEVYYVRKARRGGERQRSGLPSPRIMRDIDPYRSVITGEMITSRSKHRDHLREHNCVELGNDKPKPPPPPDPKAGKAETVQVIKKAAREHGVDIL